jgi:maleate isomerase
MHAPPLALPPHWSPLAGRVRIGMLTPSSNTVLEPVVAAMFAELPAVSCHFARFPVTRISLDAEDLGQFDPAPLLAAARLLADAKVGVIAWAGTSGSWLGESADRALCAAIEAETGIPATTSVLAVRAALDRMGAATIGLVTPYVGDVQARIVANYEAQGIACVAERHLDDHGNFSFATWTEERIGGLVREVAAARPDAVVVMCTNFLGAPIAAALEAETGVPVIDSIAAAAWHALLLTGARPRTVRGWGRLLKDFG